MENLSPFQEPGRLSGTTFSVRRDILKPDLSSVNLKNYSYVEKSFANIQNIYAKYNGDVLVSSPSIPFYHDSPLDFYDKKISLDGSYNGEEFSTSENHGYFTGDKVYYESYVYTDDEGEVVESKFPEIDSGVYYVKRIDKNKFKLAANVTNLFNNNFVSVSGIVTNNYICSNDFYKKILNIKDCLENLKHQ